MSQQMLENLKVRAETAEGDLAGKGTEIEDLQRQLNELREQTGGFDVKGWAPYLKNVEEHLPAGQPRSFTEWYNGVLSATTANTPADPAPQDPPPAADPQPAKPNRRVQRS